MVNYRYTFRRTLPVNNRPVHNRNTLRSLCSILALTQWSQDMNLRHIIHHPSRLHDVKFCKRVDGDGELMLVAAEDKKVSIYDLPSDPDIAPSIIAEMVGHSNRSVAFMKSLLPGSSDPFAE